MLWKWICVCQAPNSVQCSIIIHTHTLDTLLRTPPPRTHTPAKHTHTQSQQAGGTHPIGMLSYFTLCSFTSWNAWPSHGLALDLGVSLEKEWLRLLLLLPRVMEDRSLLVVCVFTSTKSPRGPPWNEGHRPRVRHETSVLEVPAQEQHEHSFCSSSTNAFITYSLYTVRRYRTSPGTPDLRARLGWLQGSTGSGM